MTNLSTIMQVKIIHYSGFINKKEKSENHPKRDEDQFYFASWAGQIAKRIKKRAPHLDIEVWSADREFDKVSCRTIEGIKACVFPYRWPVLIPGSLTFRMFYNLRKLSRRYRIIIHTHSIFNFYLHLFLCLFVPKAKVVSSHHGGLPPDSTTVKGKLSSFLLRKSLQQICFGTYQNNSFKIFVNKLKNSHRFSFLPVGADFKLFQPMDKLESRRRLNLNENTIYAIFIGKLYRLKGVDVILDTYDKLKINYNFRILFIGSIYERERELYERIERSDCIFYGFKKHEDIPFYLSAADFYLHPIFNPSVGVDVAQIEAMAMGLPVVGARLNTLEIDYRELGYQVDHPELFAQNVEKMINTYKWFDKVRETAITYFDSNTSITDQYIMYYNQIAND